MKGQGCVDTAEEKGLFMQWWIIPSWKKSVRITECSSAVESRQIPKALGGALFWLFGVPGVPWLPKIRVSGVFLGAGTGGGYAWEKILSAGQGKFREKPESGVGREVSTGVGGAGCLGKVWFGIFDGRRSLALVCGLGREECCSWEVSKGVTGSLC